MIGRASDPTVTSVPRQTSDMADVKGGTFAKAVQKHAGRAKEKILQNLGKADKTTDEVFDEFETNFSRQQNNANRLQKEVANYLRCCRALHGASKSLLDTLTEVYEPEWVGHDLLYAQSQNYDMLWTDFCHKIQDQTLAPLTAYQQQFPEIRKRIDKRGRKLVDFDSQRHQLENLQRATRRDEYKIARARDNLDNAKVTYEGLNKELYAELPELFDQRIPNIASHLQTLFAAEATFMGESSKVSKELEAISDKLGKECAKGTYKTKRVAAPRPLSVIESSPLKNPGSPSMWYDADPEGNEGSFDISAANDDKEEDEGRSPTPPPPPPPQGIQEKEKEGTREEEEEEEDDNRPTISAPVSPAKEEGGIGRPYEEIEFEERKVNGAVSSPARTNGEVVIGTKVPTETTDNTQGSPGPTFTSPLAEITPNSEQIYDIPVGATTEGLPAGCLYRVRATYKYTREDVDEIGFDVGDVIQVVEYEDPEEQEEGWLTGVKETTLEKGLFPANFTRPI